MDESHLEMCPLDSDGVGEGVHMALVASGSVWYALRGEGVQLAREALKSLTLNNLSRSRFSST